MDLESLGPGDVLADKFRLDSLLGRGGMGSVWRAHHLSLNSPVALKLIDPTLAAHPEARARFIREAQAAAALRSPHVVQTFDFGLHGDVPYIAMELLEGESLADRLERERTISPAMIAHIMTHVARAMTKAHEVGIVHRDLKPDNIFLVSNEDEEIAKVLDFGVAKATGATALGSDSRTRTGALLGTPFYMSPEQAQGDKTVDWRSDLWSMAIITYECLLGHRPLVSDGLGNLLVQICVAPMPVPSQRGSVPAGFDEWWARATERDPARRFQSARELAKALRVALTGGNVRGSMVSSPGFDAAGNPIDDRLPDHSGVGSLLAVGPPAAGSHPDAGQPGIQLGWGSTAVMGGAGGASDSTGGVGTATVDDQAIPKGSNLGLVLALLAVVFLLGGGAVVAVAIWAFAVGGGTQNTVAEPLGDDEPLGDEDPDDVADNSGASDDGSSSEQPSAGADDATPTASAEPSDEAAPAVPPTTSATASPKPTAPVAATSRPVSTVRRPPPSPPQPTATATVKKPQDRLGF